MAKQRFLKNAPIREALIDIKLSPPTTAPKLEPVFEVLKQEFPQQEILQQSTFGFEVAADAVRTSRVDGGVQGRRLISADGKHIVQLRVDGFTFSRLPPYETWESMRRHAEPLWRTYIDATGAEQISRVAIRYINVMDLPMPISDFKEYLVAPPSLPEGLPQEVGGFFSRIAVVEKEIGAAAFITQALEGSLENKAQVVLDIDVFREPKSADLSAGDMTVWAKLEQLRHFKNRIFFESITEKTAGLFE